MTELDSGNTLIYTIDLPQNNTSMNNTTTTDDFGEGWHSQNNASCWDTRSRWDFDNDWNDYSGNEYNVDLIQFENDQDYNENALEFATKISNITAACLESKCSVYNNNMTRANVFLHDKNDSNWSYWSVYQKPFTYMSGSSIYLSHYIWTDGDTSIRDEYGTSYIGNFTLKLIEKGANPKIRFIGNETTDPIVITYENLYDDWQNSSISIIVYENFDMMMRNISKERLDLSRQSRTTNKEVSPALSYMYWYGSLYSSYW